MDIQQPLPFCIISCYQQLEDNDYRDLILETQAVTTSRAVTACPYFLRLLASAQGNDVELYACRQEVS